MSKFSVRPTLTLKGRTFKGLRGWSGKPSHPPLTDIPIAAYMTVAFLDILSAIGGEGDRWTEEFWHVATFVLLGGVAISVLAALTGLADARQSSEAGTQARRTINTHASIMIVVTLLAIADLIWRLSVYDSQAATPVGLAVLSLVVALLVALGSTFGGSLVFEYGFNVETSGDHPVWHKSDVDVLPGRHAEVGAVDGAEVGAVNGVEVGTANGAELAEVP